MASIWPKSRVSPLIVENATQFLNVFHWSSSSQSSSKVGAYLAVPQLQDLIPCFLSQQSNPDRDLPLIRIPLTLCPNFNGRIHVLPSATSLYYAPSDKSSIRRMYQERIHAVKSWRKCPARNDCAFVEYNADEPELSFQVLDSHDQVVLGIYDGSKWLRLSKVKIASAGLIGVYSSSYHHLCSSTSLYHVLLSALLQFTWKDCSY